MAITSDSLVKWSVVVVCEELVYSWPLIFVIVTELFFFCLFACFALISIHGTVAGVGVLLAVTHCLVCPIRVVAGVSVSLATHVFVLFYTHLGE